MADYADVQVVNDAWTQLAAASDAVRVQSQGGSVRLSTKAAPAGDTGILLRAGEVLDISAGKAIWYRGVGGSATLVREVL